MKTVFISGKISGDKNYKDKFAKAENQLIAKGYNVINPAREIPDDTSWFDSMQACFDDIFERINMFAALCGDFDDSEKIKTSPAPTDNLPDTRRTAYDSRKSTIDTLREKFKLQLSHCDLEEDLCEALGSTRFAELMSEATAAEAIKRLKSKKQHIMIELVGQLSKDDCSKIYAHYNFACLKAVRNEA